MAARLFARRGPLRGRQIEFQREATVGRSSEATLRIRDGTVSRSHARIRFDPDEGAYFLEDLDSAQGTEVDGVPVTGRQRLGRLAVLTFASHLELIFQDIGDCVRRSAAAGIESAKPVEEKATLPCPRFSLEVTNLESGPRRFPLEPGANRIRLTLGTSPAALDLFVEGTQVTCRRVETSPPLEMDGRTLPDDEAVQVGAQLRFGAMRARLIRDT